MSDNQDPFLIELQKQCLTDSSEQLEAMMESLAGLPGALEPVLKVFRKSLHTLKGNMQVAGFLNFAEFLHNVESAMEPLQQACEKGSFELSEGDQRALEFFLSDLHHAIKTYVEELQINTQDGPQFLELRRAAIYNLTQWWMGLQNQKVEAPSVARAETSSPAAVAVEGSPVSAQAVAPPIPRGADATTKPVTETQRASPKKIDTERVNDLYLLFRVGKQDFAIDVNHVLEIVTPAPIVRLPVPRKDVRGLVNLRGETVSVLELQAVLGELKEARYLVICENQGQTFAFETEDANEVLLIPAKDLMPLSHESVQSGFGSIGQVARVRDRQVLMFQLVQAAAA